MGGAYVMALAVALLYAVTFPALGPLAVIISWALALLGIGAVVVFGLFRGATYTRHLAVLGWRPVTAYFSGLGKGRKNK
jgi:hypothetical protein